MPKTLFVIFLLTLLCVGTLSAQGLTAMNNQNGLFLQAAEGRYLEVTSFQTGECVPFYNANLVLERWNGWSGWQIWDTLRVQLGSLTRTSGLAHKRFLGRFTNLPPLTRVVGEGMRLRVRVEQTMLGAMSGCAVGTAANPFSHFETAYFTWGVPNPREMSPSNESGVNAMIVSVGSELLTLVVFTPHSVRVVVSQEVSGDYDQQQVIDVSPSSNLAPVTIPTKNFHPGILKLYLLDKEVGWSFSNTFLFFPQGVWY